MSVVTTNDVVVLVEAMVRRYQSTRTSDLLLLARSFHARCEDDKRFDPFTVAVMTL